MTTTTLILPGLFNSGPDHWQSHWERHDASCVRVTQANWDTPDCLDWVRTLDETVSSNADEVVLVAHSSSGALVSHWAARATDDRLERVRGALLVAPSDPDGPHYPDGPSGFSPMPLGPLPFPSILVASTNDIYVSLTQARAYAFAWGSRFIVIGAVGHINADSGFGRWPEGYELLRELRGDQRGAESF